MDYFLKYLSVLSIVLYSTTVPIYDLRGSLFSFRREDFDGLRNLPQFNLDGVPKDLPGDSLVTVAHTVSSFVGDGRKILSLNVQFVMFHVFLIFLRVTEILLGHSKLHCMQ